MMTMMMTNNETLADIVAEMRTYFQAKKRGNPEHRPWHQVLSDWADRIDAAAKREMAKGMSKKLDGNRSIPGDAAALRAALEAMLDECCNLCDVPNQMSESGCECSWRNRWSGCQSKTIDKALTALAAPARNCDRYGADGAAVACRKALGIDWSHIILVRKVIGWLFSPAEGGAEC